MYAIVVAILSMLACVLVAALISDPTLIAQFGVVVWKLLGTDSPFFWMLTFPATIMIGLFVAYYLWLSLTTSSKRKP